MKDEDILFGSLTDSQFNFGVFTRCYNAMANCRNDIWRTQAAAFAASLEFNDKFRETLSHSEDREQALATQQALIRQYAETVQGQSKRVVQLWVAAWGSIGEVLVPAAVNEALVPLSAAVATSPGMSEASNRIKANLKTDGKEDVRRSSAA